jgi:isopenicillin-N epimerase
LATANREELRRFVAPRRAPLGARSGVGSSLTQEVSMNLSRRTFLGTAALSGAAAVAPSQLLAAPRAPATTPAFTPASAAVDLHDWNAVRALFELEPDRVHAALFFLASHPRPVRDEVERLRKRLDANPHDAVEEAAFGPPEHNLGDKSLSAIARYIGGSPADVALTNSTTHGLALVYQGLPLGAGDEMLTSEHDHFVHHESVRLVAERTGATARRVRLFEGHDASAATAEGIVRALKEAISPATRTLGVTWVHSSSGLKLPLRALAAALREVNGGREPARRVILVVDGVHGLGADDPKVAETGVDVFVSGLHKWMLAPRGTGFVWARPEIWARMRPSAPSFGSGELFGAWFEGRTPPGPPRASYFSLGGFQAFEHVWAIAKAIELHEAIGPERVKERVQALNGRAREELARAPHVQLRTPRDPSLCAGITAFEVDGLAPRDAVERLREQRVVATTSPYRPSYVRLSFGIANSEGDVEKALAAVRGLG